MTRAAADSPFFTRWLPDYLAVLLVERGLAPNSVAAYRSDLASFGRWLAHDDCAVEACDRARVRRYLTAMRGRGLSARSAARALASLLGFFRYLLARGADPNIRNQNGASALDWAKRNDDKALVERLRRAGALE